MQIAKRMRELHDGIELYDDERRAGPNVFRNWWKWVDRCEQVISWLDKEMLSPDNADKAVREPWRKVGLVCGVPWPQFRKAVESYQEYLSDWYGGATEINSRLVFAHSDVGDLSGALVTGANPYRLNTAMSCAWNPALHPPSSSRPMNINNS